MIRCSRSTRIQTSFWKRSFCLAAASISTTTTTTAFLSSRTRSFTSTSVEPPPVVHTCFHLTCQAVEQESLDWVKRVVIGWNLCPFADHPLRTKQLTMHVIRGGDDETVLASVMDECFHRATTDGTTLVVAPECHPDDFRSFLDVLADAEEFLNDQHELDLQIAPFHPLFEFADSQGISTFTNRSPYPMFHILRQDQVSKAVEKLNGDSSLVWQRNVNLLEDLGNELNEESVKALVAGAGTKDQEIILQQVLKRNKFTLGTGSDDMETIDTTKPL